MNKCYVCECETGVARSHSDKYEGGIYICSGGCETQYNALSALATAAEAQAMPEGVRIICNNESVGYKPKLTAYSDMSLFEPVDLGDDLIDCSNEPDKFVLPLVIEAIPAFDSQIVFLVKERNRETKFEPKKEGAKEFATVKEALDFANTLEPIYQNWTFKLWSKEALI